MNLRWYQEEAVSSVFDYLSSGKGNSPLIALPTGTGKSLVIAKLVTNVLQWWPDRRVIALTHVKELIQNNHDTLKRFWPGAPAGIYSGWPWHETDFNACYLRGIGSVKNAVGMFGPRDIMIVDEAHLLSGKANSMYGEVITGLRTLRPNMPVIGLTATAYRLGMGLLTDGGLFDGICYDQTGMEAFNRLIAEGWLAPLRPKKTELELDLGGVGISNGDFKQAELEAAVDREDTTWHAVNEACEWGADRRAWLVFASGIAHAEHVSEALNRKGVPTRAVHSKITAEERDTYIKDFKAGRLRCLVNNNVLTTGFDHPPIDFVVMLRPTVSPGLWVQMLGRGTRPSPATGKTDCLVLDFAGNTRRLGPINDPKIPRKKGEGSGEAPVKICEHCGTYNHTSVRLCVHCGEPFPIESKIIATADTAALLADNTPIVETFPVDYVAYKKHEKAGKAPSLRVSYQCGLRQFNEWIHLESGTYADKRGRDWWRERAWGRSPVDN
jgi:DNA repair protein RadD